MNTGSVFVKLNEITDQFERMGNNEFIEQFEKVIDVHKNYYFILEDLNNNVFPFHERDNHIEYRRHYYWLKQHNKLKFKHLNNHLKNIVKNKIS